jgi:hypothetical protein
MKTYFQGMLVVWLAVQGGIASAQMELQSYAANRHDRFYVGADKAFIGDPYDWSGVGRVVGEGITHGWATMISPHCFLSAYHFHPALSETLRFYEANDPSGSFEDHAIDSGMRIGDTDLWLGKLEAPVTSAAIYPILSLPGHSDYEGRVIYTFGRSDTTPQETNVRLGRNNIDFVALPSEPDENGSIGEILVFDYDYPAGGVGADESHLQPYDSGGPSLAVLGGSPALVGIHWFIGDDPVVFSADSFVPDYITQLNAAMAELGGVEFDEQVTVLVPEPSVLVMLLGLGVGCLAWSAQRRARRRAGR